MIDDDMKDFQYPSVSIHETLMDNEVLRTHPFLRKEFVAKGCRSVPFGIGNKEFAKLYSDGKEMAPDDEKDWWDYPPDFEAMETVDYWVNLGLRPAGVVSFKTVEIQLMVSLSDFFSFP